MGIHVDSLNKVASRIQPVQDSVTLQTIDHTQVVKVVLADGKVEERIVRVMEMDDKNKSSVPSQTFIKAGPHYESMYKEDRLIIGSELNPDDAGPPPSMAIQTRGEVRRRVMKRQ